MNTLRIKIYEFKKNILNKTTIINKIIEKYEE